MYFSDIDLHPSSFIVYYLHLFLLFFFFFFNDTATTEIYTLSLHDALPILIDNAIGADRFHKIDIAGAADCSHRSEEHTSELQSHSDLVCRLLLEKKKKKKKHKPKPTHKQDTRH